MGPIFPVQCELHGVMTSFQDPPPPNLAAQRLKFSILRRKPPALPAKLVRTQGHLVAKKGSILTCGAMSVGSLLSGLRWNSLLAQDARTLMVGMQWLVISIFSRRDFFTIFWEITQNLYPKVASFQWTILQMMVTVAILDLKWSPSHLNKTESDHFVFSLLALQAFVS